MYIVVIFVLCLKVLPAEQLQPIVPSDAVVPLDEMWGLAKDYYFKEDYHTSIKLIEKSLVTYRMMQHVKIACHAKCVNTSIEVELPTISFSKHPELFAMGNLVVQANCIKLCREQHPYRLADEDNKVSSKVLEEFENRLPYNFLQFAYFKTDRMKQACQAMYTYFQANPNGEGNLENIEYYKSLPNNTEDDFKDLEAAKFYKFYLAGIDAYSKNNHKVVIESMERALVEYFKEYSDCEAMCFKPHLYTHFEKLYKSISLQFESAINCSLSCEPKLSPVINGVVVSNFVAQCFFYLQFSYFHIGNVGMAAPAAASAELFNPGDTDAKSNMKYYMKSAAQHGLSSIHLSPRLDAVKFHQHLSMLTGVLKQCETLHPDDEGELQNEEIYDVADSDNNDEFYKLLDEKILKKIEERFTL